jgi:NAD(P)-dependent dehydrogenase (short-subunit alcohol dehydrogenase family)
MSYQFNGRTVLITGAAQGLGKGIARRFLESDAQVIITDINDEKGKQAEKELSEFGKVCYRHMDVTDENQVRETISAISKEYTKLDYAVNNAAFIQTSCPLHEQGTDIMRKTVEVDLMGVYYCLKYEICQMNVQKHGVIVNISSIAGLSGMKGMGPYSAVKHAIIGLTKSAALDYAGNNIRINAVCPGMIDTEAVKELREKQPEILQNYEKSIPIGRMASTIEIANAVTWLCSSQATYATGTCLVIDGGSSI